jgi:hypothetical protein
MVRAAEHGADDESLSRRTFLRRDTVSSLVLAASGDIQAGTRAALKPIILIWEDGGASSLETFDAKPESPSEIRGEWGSIVTRTGAVFSDHLPLVAAESERFSVIRAIHTKESGHASGIREYLGAPVLPLQYKRGGVKYTTIHVPGGFSSIDQGHDAGKADFRIEWDEHKKEYVPPQLEPTVPRERLLTRRDLLRAFSDTPLSKDQELGLDLLLGGGQLQAAFRLPAKDREAFGSSPIGDGMLLAERLTEAGASFVTVNVGNFDVHDNMYDRLGRLLPPFDRALATLLKRNRRSVIAVCGEFNRTPRINRTVGRDHWTEANTALVTGKPIVFGSTDKDVHGRDGVVSAKQYRNTILALAGVRLPGNEYIPATVS